MIGFHFSLPLVGILIGSTNRFINLNLKQSISILITVILLILIYSFTDISFFYDALDLIIIDIGLLMLGYFFVKNFWDNFLFLKIFMVIYFILTPTFFLYYIFIGFNNNWIEEIIKSEKDRCYKIKHIRKNSNFNFEGYHIVKIYKKFIVIEYPINYYLIGTYGEFGFNSYEQNKDGVLIQINHFKYDDINEKLILYNYTNGKHIKIKEFNNDKPYKQI